MNLALRKPMTLDEFLAWEERQELRYEFDGLQPVAMTGGTDAHSALTGNLLTALNIRLRGKLCRSRGPDMKVETGGKYRYPDAVVTCTPVPPNATVVAEPVAIFEVPSKGTARDDRTVKLLEYQSLPSVRRYVMLEQDQALVTVIARTGTDTGWSLELLRADAVLAMPEIGVELPVADLYADVTFAPESAP